jgi:carboxyl-terminal processing protease
MKFVKEKNFSYTTESEKAIEKLKKIAKEEGYLEKIKPQIDMLEKNLATEKDNDLLSNRKDIEELLRSEIVSRYYYQKGRIVASLNDDPDLKRAFEILLNTNGRDEYHSILSGK